MKRVLSYPVIVATAIFILVVISYSNHFNNGFHFDDMHTIVNNVHIRNLKNIPAFYSDPKMFSASPAHWGMRPLVTTTLAIDYFLGNGLKPFFFQLSTFIWHLLLVILLYFIFRNLLNRTFADKKLTSLTAILGAGWFAIHTANAETLNYIISRSDVLSTFFIALSFLLFVLLPGKRKYLLYVIPAIIGVFAKETVPVLVLLLFFYLLFFESGLSVADIFKPKHFKTILNIVLQLLPSIIIIAGFQLYTLSKIKAIEGVSNPAGYYMLTQPYVWLRYCIAFFLPGNLSADSDWGVITNVFDERIIIGLVFFSILLITVIKTSAKKETEPIAFGLVWFITSLLPTSLVPFSEVTNDHRMYFAFIGLTLALIAFILLQVQKYNQRKPFSVSRKIVFATVIGAAFLLQSFGVYQRNKVWKTEESLWLDVTKKSPMNGRGLMNYGLTQMEKGNYTVANEYFEKALVYTPYYHSLFINLGILKNAMGNPAEADSYFKKAILYGPNYVESYTFYSRFLSQNNRFDESVSMSEKALSIDSYSTMSLNNLMTVYLQTQNWNKLVQTAQRYLSIIPDDKNAMLYLESGNNKRNMFMANAPTQIKNTTAEDYLSTSLIYYNNKEYEKCINTCYEALKIKPNLAEAYNNMGAAYNQLGQWQKGIEACTKALQINPNFPLAKANLEWAKNHLNKAK
ncbi:MAG: hypothetical protein C0459_10835 [Chitinophaga sp.]|jgi:protein O-mannosyl-transferase|nr:hypothetical protein [Chitinophaga sp.]